MMIVAVLDPQEGCDDMEEPKICATCAYERMGGNDHPCRVCKLAYLGDDPRHTMYALQWVSKKDDEPTNSNVDHPAHYQGRHECIDEMIALFGIYAVMNFCACNVYKYRYRAAAKNGQEDLDKANWYMDKLMELQKVSRGQSNDQD